MRIACIGGGPAGLYLSVLLKKTDPHHQVVVIEQCRKEDAFGFGLTIPESGLTHIKHYDTEIYQAIRNTCIGWHDISIVHQGRTLNCGGHTLHAIGRKQLLSILQNRTQGLGVDLRFQTQVKDLSLFEDYDLIVVADGSNSSIRSIYADKFRPTIEQGKTRFIWFGTSRLHDALTFTFEHTDQGFFAAHTYPFDERYSTFIVEISEDTWQKVSRHFAEELLPYKEGEKRSLNYCEKVFKRTLDARALLSNNSHWSKFRTVRNEQWYYNNIVLIGDAAHTMHFSAGLGTQTAMGDAAFLHDMLQSHTDISTALQDYERRRRPQIKKLQDACGSPSLTWWENLDDYCNIDPEVLAFRFLTRTKFVTYSNLMQRDPIFTRAIDQHFASRFVQANESAVEPAQAASPLFRPGRIKNLILKNRCLLSLPVSPSTFQRLPDQAQATNASLIILEVPCPCLGPWTLEQQDIWRMVKNNVVKDSKNVFGLFFAHDDCETQESQKNQGPLLDDYTDVLEEARRLRFSFLELSFDLHCSLARSMLAQHTIEQESWGLTNRDSTRYLFEHVRRLWSDSPLGIRLSIGSALDEESGKGSDPMNDLMEVVKTLQGWGIDIISFLPAGEKSNFFSRTHTHTIICESLRRKACLPITLANRSSRIQSVFSIQDELDTSILAGQFDFFLLKMCEPSNSSPGTHVVQNR